MVLHHVPQRTRFVITIPERLKDRVTETSHNDVLRCLFAEIVIDTIGVFLGKNSGHHVIEALGTGQIFANGFFHNDARPPAMTAFIESGLLEMAQDLLKVVGSGGQIK